MEYKRSVVRTLINLYFVAREEDNPTEAIRFFSQTAAGYKPREVKLVLEAIAGYLSEADARTDKASFLTKLEMWIASH